MKKTSIGGIITFIAVLALWSQSYQNKANRDELKRNARERMFMRFKTQEKMAHERSLFSNATQRVCLGQDRDVVFKDFIAESKTVVKGSETAKRLKEYLWLVADVGIATTNLSTRLCAIRHDYVGCFLTMESGGLSLPEDPQIVVAYCRKALAEYRREVDSYEEEMNSVRRRIADAGTNVSAIIISENRFAEVYDENSFVRQLYELWVGEAEKLCSIGTTLAKSSKWRIELGVPVCDDSKLYSLIFGYCKELDSVENKVIALCTTLPDVNKAGGPFEREPNQICELFENANKNDVKSIFGIPLGAKCVFVKGGIRRNPYNPYDSQSVPDVLKVDGVSYECGILSNYESGYADLALHRSFHSLKAARVRFDKASHQIYQIEASCSSGFGELDVAEKTEIINQINAKFGIELQHDGEGGWFYFTKKHGKKLLVSFVRGFSICLTDVQGERQSERVQSALDYNAL